MYGEPRRWVPVAGGGSMRGQDPSQAGGDRVADREVLSSLRLAPQNRVLTAVRRFIHLIN